MADTMQKQVPGNRQWPVWQWTDGELLAEIAERGDRETAELRNELDARRAGRRRSTIAAVEAYRQGRAEPRI